MTEKQVRYSVIREKNLREILMLRGSGCKWRKCAFCDYHLDFSLDEEENFRINMVEIENVTGEFGKLEVINSGSFTDLDEKTRGAIIKTCQEKNIGEIHIETHWMHRNELEGIREVFKRAGVEVKVKIGVETFQEEFREKVLKKGMVGAKPEEIAKYCDEACLLFGLKGQREETMKRDIETGLKYFQRICINIMTPNTTAIKPDEGVIKTFIDKIYPKYVENPRVDILLNNTDFGVGGRLNE